MYKTTGVAVSHLTRRQRKVTLPCNVTAYELCQSRECVQTGACIALLLEFQLVPCQPLRRDQGIDTIWAIVEGLHGARNVSQNFVMD